MTEDIEKMRGRAHRNAVIRILVVAGVVAFVLICIVMFIISKFHN
jgi:hypothetical protein